MINSGELTHGALIAFILYTAIFAKSCTGLTTIWAQWQKLVGAGRRVFQIFLESPSVRTSPDALPFDGSHETVTFSNVCFRYPTHPDREVLRDVSFSANRGEVIAIVGRSGSGEIDCGVATDSLV